LAFKGVVLKVGPPQEVDIEDGFNWVCNGAALQELSKPARVYIHSQGSKYLLCTLSNNQPQYTLALVLPDAPFNTNEQVSLSIESENPKAEVHITGVLSLQEGPGDLDGLLGSSDESDMSESGSDEESDKGLKLAQQAASARPADKKDAGKAAPAKGAPKAQQPKAQQPKAAAKGKAPAKPQPKESSSEDDGSEDEGSSEGSDSGSDGSESGSGEVNLPEISSEESSEEEKPKKKAATAPNTPSQKPKGPATPGKGPATPGQKPKGSFTPGQKPKGPPTPGGGAVTCFKCGKPGHKSPQCPQASPAGGKPSGPGEKRKQDGPGSNPKKFKK